MNEEIAKISPLDADKELVALVDGFLDGSLSGEEKERLERRLENDESAQAYCADRIRFHADLQEMMQPLRVEMMEKKHVVFERKWGIPHLKTRVSQMIRIGEPGSKHEIVLPDNLIDPKTARRRLFVVVCVFAVVLMGVVTYLVRQNASKSSQVASASTDSKSLPTLVLKNAGFEHTDLSRSKNGLSYTLLDWQDHFSSEDARLSELEYTTKGKYTAHSGKNVAYLEKGGFLTQRLFMSDGPPLTAQKGLSVRIRGWMMVPNSPSNHRSQLRFSLRVIVGVKPEKVQYEPVFAYASVHASTWVPFQVDLTLPTDSLIKKVSDYSPGLPEAPDLDLTGYDLSLSIDSQTEPLLFLDDLSVELLKK